LRGSRQPPSRRDALQLAEPFLDALHGAGPDAPAVGLELARALVERSRERVAGIYVIPPFKQPLGALDLLA